MALICAPVSVHTYDEMTTVELERFFGQPRGHSRIPLGLKTLSDQRDTKTLKILNGARVALQEIDFDECKHWPRWKLVRGAVIELQPVIDSLLFKLDAA